MSEDRVRVAAFDVDGTLTRRDCVVPFLTLVGGPVRAPTRFLRRPVQVGTGLARRQRDVLKAHAAFAAFAGQPTDRIESLADRFAERVATRWMRPDSVARLRRHQADGDVVVLVSASFEVYLEPLAHRLGVDHVLATRLVVADDRYTGALDGPNCRGPEKVHRLHRWADDRFAGRAALAVTAYGDSTGDRELLLDADEGHWMGAGRPPTWFPR